MPKTALAAIAVTMRAKYGIECANKALHKAVSENVLRALKAEKRARRKAQKQQKKLDMSNDSTPETSHDRNTRGSVR